ncbi:urea transporter [Filimonas zeae]|uniref:Holin n=1 Tax=Filimonas zeae TaxID=1737353 RepID=A0A917IT31_9BACT|nr:hypothetical protein [Filimonas zeae]MDR6339459.1 urea transporter [Filimonas zeae]GGH63501.1 hypothetical protein GCM10011379_14480 [Filimonas zeae]
MNQYFNNTDTRAGIAGGVLCTVSANLSNADLTKTIVLAALGAAVSVVVTIAMQQLLHRWRK